MSDSSARGMPLLSGPPPIFESASRSDLSCRRCNKEFNMVFVRDRRCNHCGYLYCNSCSEYQALMPRQGVESGYDPMSVCAFCIQYLTITAGGKGYLRTQALARLRNYVQAYNIKVGNDILEKEDIIDAIVAARNNTGCLPRANEDYYRKHAVPNGQTTRPRGLFSRSAPRPAPRQNVNSNIPSNQNSSFARPDLDPSTNQQQRYPPPPYPPPREQQQQRSSRTAPQPEPPLREQQRTTRPPPPSPRPSTNQDQSHGGRTYPPPPFAPGMDSRNTNNSSSSSFAYARREPHEASPRMSTYSNNNPQYPPPSPRAPSPPYNARTPASTSAPTTIPSLDELILMTEEEFSRLSVGKLKGILTQNHVSGGVILEKGELIDKVGLLIETERQERSRAEAYRAQEELEQQWRREEQELERQRVRLEKERQAREEREREQARWRAEHRTTVEEAGDESTERISPLNSVEECLLRPSTPPPVNTESAVKNADSQPKAAESAPSRPVPPPVGERSGICVICTDEEANIVIVDCGHLAMCRTCADLVMKSSRECPLCRTRIVTEKRLLRVFKS